METLVEPKVETFVERRSESSRSTREGGPERRQFRSSSTNLRPEAAELAQAVDQYKLQHRRRFITFEELHNVITELGYRK
jgi:hypothetical protein